jgi:hypothetical protein
LSLLLLSPSTSPPPPCGGARINLAVVAPNGRGAHLYLVVAPPTTEELPWEMTVMLPSAFEVAPFSNRRCCQQKSTVLPAYANMRR